MMKELRLIVPFQEITTEMLRNVTIVKKLVISQETVGQKGKIFAVIVLDLVHLHGVGTIETAVGQTLVIATDEDLPQTETEKLIAETDVIIVEIEVDLALQLKIRGRGMKELIMKLQTHQVKEIKDAADRLLTIFGAISRVSNLLINKF
jgi:hypothetical protein